MPYSFPDVGKVVLLGITKATRAAIGKDVGDEVEVELVRDDASRSATFEMPAELQAALEADAAAKAAFEQLAPSHRREYAQHVAEAKQPATRRAARGAGGRRTSRPGLSRRGPRTRRQGRARHRWWRRCRPLHRTRVRGRRRGGRRALPLVGRTGGGCRRRHPRRRRAGDRGPGRPGEPGLDRRSRCDGRARARARSACWSRRRPRTAASRLAETSDEDWEAVVDDMLGATFRACRAVIPSMQAAGSGGSSTSPRGRDSSAWRARRTTPRPRPGSWA